MIRRPPTTIKLTLEDILAYDDAAAVQHTQSVLASTSGATGLNGAGLVSLAERPKTQDERVGARR